MDKKPRQHRFKSLYKLRKEGKQPTLYFSYFLIFSDIALYCKPYSQKNVLSLKHEENVEITTFESLK